MAAKMHKREELTQKASGVVFCVSHYLARRSGNYGCGNPIVVMVLLGLAKKRNQEQKNGKPNEAGGSPGSRTSGRRQEFRWGEDGTGAG
jgi:hypothetical protein